MEGNNPSFIFGQSTTTTSYPFPLDPSFVIQPTNNLSPPPFLEAITSLPINTSIPTIHNSFSPTNIDFPNMLQYSNVRSTPSIDLYPSHYNNNQATILSNSTINTSLSLLQSPSLPIQDNGYMYNLPSEVPPKTHLNPLPLSNLFAFGNQASLMGYQLPNPFLVRPSANYLYSVANDGLDIAWNHPPLVHESGTTYRCSICRMEFPTSQAYGGHMSSHSKAKKARAKLELSMREAKKARLAEETGPLINLPKRESVSRVSKGKEIMKKDPIKESSTERIKGKNVTAMEDMKEAEVIQTEVPGYASDESAGEQY